MHLQLKNKQSNLGISINLHMSDQGHESVHLQGPGYFHVLASCSCSSASVTFSLFEASFHVSPIYWGWKGHVCPPLATCNHKCNICRRTGQIILNCKHFFSSRDSPLFHGILAHLFTERTARFLQTFSPLSLSIYVCLKGIKSLPQTLIF